MSQAKEGEGHKKVDLDTILIEEIGQFGFYHIKTLALSAIGVIFAAFHSEYVFTTARINSRCLIPECEDPGSTSFITPWLDAAIPSSDGCLTTATGTMSPPSWSLTCPVLPRSSIRGSLWNVRAMSTRIQRLFAYDKEAVPLMVYLIGKCSISAVTMALYVYTAELYPTRYRQNLFVLAPLTPTIVTATFEELPFILFGSFAVLSGLLLFLTPETLGTKLPDTMAEAEDIGTKR